MADGPSFAAMIVAALGTPREPFGWGHALVLGALAAAGAVWLTLEYGLGRLLGWLFDLARAPARRERDPPPDPPTLP